MKKLHVAAATVIVLAIWFIAPLAHAADGEGVGLRTCSTLWDSSKKDPSMEHYFFGWAEGFMTGLNIARLNDEPGAFKSMPQKQQMAYIRNFCEANPVRDYFDAVIELYKVLYPKEVERDKQ